MEVINENQKKFAINFVLYIFTFIFLIIIGITKVSADTYTNLAELRDVTVVLISTDNASGQPVNVAPNSDITFTYVTEVSYLVNNYNFSANTHYQLESHLTKQQFTNANHYSVQGANGEQCLITYNVPDTILNNDAYPRWSFQCPHATSSITITINNSSGEYLWSNTPTSPNYNIYQWTTALLKVSDTSMGGSGTDSENIINNQNQNTQNIINNQNQNTQDIINSNKVCNSVDLIINTANKGVTSGFLTSDGSINSNSLYSISDYVPISSNTSLNLDTPLVNSNIYYCLYNNSKILQSCVPYSSRYLTITTNYDGYVRISAYNNYTTRLTGSYCQNGSQALDDSINDLNDTLNDDDTTDAENEASEFFNSFTTETFGLTSIITAPLNLIRSLLSTGAICNNLQLPLPFLDNKYLELPCMYPIYREHFGSLFTMYQTITYGIIAYWVIVRIFNLVKDFKNPEHDEIEVMDL